MLVAAVFIALAGSPPIGPPTAKYVVIYANHDRATCDNAKDRSNTAHYFNATAGLCFPMPPPPHKLGALLLGKDASAPANMALQFAVTDAGVNIIVCASGSKGPCSQCATWHKESAVPFGECDATHQFTVDMVDWLPSPTPGRVLQRECFGRTTVDSCAERYVMEDTTCDTHCRHGMLCADVKLQCGQDKVHRPSSHEYIQYRTADGTCSGDVASIAHANYSGSAIEPITLQAFRTEWCGEECAKWKTLRAKFPFCDAPGAGTKYAIDLDTVLGGRCSKGYSAFGRFIDPTPPGECCHAALGAGHPAFKFGTPCTEVCHYYGRVGHDDEWCQVSTKEEYGACFCGSERWSGA